MSTRTISTKLAIDGEAEYKKSIANINSELKLLQSELSLVQSKYQDNANSVDALTEKGKTLNAMYDAQENKVSGIQAALANAKNAQKAHAESVAQYEQKLSDANKKMDELKSSTGDTSAEQEKLNAEMKELQAALSEAEAKEEAAAKGVRNWQQSLNYAEKDLNDLTREIKDNEKCLAEAEQSTDGYAASIDHTGKVVKKMADDVSELGQSIHQTGDAATGAGDRMNNLSVGISALSSVIVAEKVAENVKKIEETFKECSDASIEFESAITGVYKTVDGSSEQLQKISDGIKQLSTVIPLTTTELSGIAEAAGQLGIQTDNILSFTEVMANLGVATNMTAEEAATSLAKFANITGMSADNYDRLGAAIVGLGNNFATTESDVVQMSTRLASAGKIAGLTEPEILALSAAMSSVGIEAEAGGTAMSQTLAAIEKAVANGGDGLDEFARIAGMSADEFKRAWETSAISALQNFINGLGALDEQGESATLILDDLGLSAIRQSNMLKALSLSSDGLNAAIELSNNAWSQNTALTDEASKRYETAESKLQLASNAANNLKVAIGDALNPSLVDMAENGTDAFEWATEFVEENPWVVAAITGLTAALGALAVGMIAIKIATTDAAIAFRNFTAAMASNPAGQVAIAISALIGALVACKIAAEQNVDETTKRLEELRDASEAAKESFQEAENAFNESISSTDASAEVAKRYTERLEELGRKTNLTTEEQAEYAAIVDKLNETVPGLNLTIDEQTGLINGSTDALRNNIDAWVENQRIKAQENLLADKITAETEALGYYKEAYATYLDILKEGKDLEEQRNALVEDTTNNTLPEYQEQLEILNYKIEENAEKAEDAKQTQAELRETYVELKDATEDYAESLENTAEVAEDAEGAEGRLEEAAHNLSAVYNDSKAAAKESLDAQVGMWDTLDNEAVTDIKSMQTAIESQIAYYQKYNENLSALSERGIEGVDRLLDALSDGSTESAAILAGLSAASDEEIQKLIESMGEADAGKEALADTMANCTDEFRNAMDAVVEEAMRYDDMHKAGADSAQGVADGIKSKEVVVSAAGTELASAFETAYKRRLNQNSPSKLMAKDAQDTIQGLLDGYKSRENELKEAGQKAAEIAIAPYEQKAEELKKKAEKLTGEAKEAAEEAAEEYSEKAKELADKFTDAYNEYLESITGNTEIFADNLQASLDEITSAMEEVEKAQESMANKLSSYGDLFTYNENTNRVILADFDKEINQLNRYAEVLDELKSKGITDGLMSEFIDLDIDEAIKYGNTLLQKSDEQFALYNQKYEEKQQLAKEIAEKFYKDQMDALTTEFADKLEMGLDDLTNIGYDSGIDTMQGIMDGLKAEESSLYAEATRIANNLKSILSSALSSGGASVKTDGSHANGISYIPFDGYIAELHKGERVLTADEARDYINASIPTSFDIPKQPSGAKQTEAIVNAIGTLVSGMDKTQSGGDLVITIPINGIELARATIEDFRTIDAQNPQVEGDF